jgi:dTDP-glucose 4,6-dehydratase
MRLLVTGAAGFIGSAYVRHVLATQPGDEIVALDLLTYAGRLTNLDDVLGDSRVRFVHGDIADAEAVAPIAANVDAIVNFAAETHVDRSLLEPEAFARANVIGVMTLLEAARRAGLRMVQVSTDEVYGDVPEAYATSYGADVVVTRGCNTIGPRQYPEKLVPLFVTNALQDLPLPVYGDGRQVRNWLHVEDHARAIDIVLRAGRTGQAYNIGAENERENLAVIRAILDRLGKPHSLVRHVADRPGHDRRYALDTSRIRDELGWAPHRDWLQSLHDTVDWYVANPGWWRAIRHDDGRFREFYEQQYGVRLGEESRQASRVSSW